MSGATTIILRGVMTQAPWLIGLLLTLLVYRRAPRAERWPVFVGAVAARGIWTPVGAFASVRATRPQFISFVAVDWTVAVLLTAALLVGSTVIWGNRAARAQAAGKLSGALLLTYIVKSVLEVFVAFVAIASVPVGFPG